MSSERCLEFFFGEVPHFLGLSSRYPHLSKLTIVGQEDLTSLRGLETLTQLRELWVVECGLALISHLQNAERLEKLYLYSNQIEAIDGLSRCSSLTTLWLDDNRITSMSSLQLLPSLRELNLAQNRIARLPAVDWGQDLDWLNLSGNPLPLTDLPALAQLPRLSELHLQDPTYRPAACTSLCNFRLFCVQLLPRLQQLDGVPILKEERAESRRQLAARLVYYRALCRHVRARCQEQVAQVRQDWNGFLATMGRRLRLLQAKCLQVEAAEPAEDAVEPEVSRETLHAFRDALRRRMDCVASVARGQLAHSRERLDMLTRRRRVVQALLELEFRTVGNIHCEELNVSDAADGGRTSMLTQFLGRTSLSASKTVQLLAMYKVSNRFLEHRMVQKSASTPLARVFSRFVTSEQPQDLDWILEACKGNITTRVNLTADLDLPDDPKGARPLASLREYFGGFREAILIQVIAMPEDQTKPGTVPASLEPRSEELTTGKLIFAPKFVVLFTTAEFDNRSISCLSSATLDDDLLNSVCLPVSEPTAMSKTEGTVLKPSSVDSERVIMPGGEIAIVKCIENSAHIVEIDLSFNELRSVQFLSNMLVLKSLNLSYNYIKSIKSLPMLPSLNILNISWNRLDSLTQTMRRLSTTCPQLKTLDIGFNPWFESEQRQGKIAAVLLPGLRDLKGQNLFRTDPGAPVFRRFQSPMDIGDLTPPKPVTQTETANRLDPRRLTAVCLDGQVLQNLSCIREILFLQKLSVNDNMLCSLEGLEQFHHLEYLSADFNELTDFSGLPQSSMKLRSLSVRHNNITNLESLISISLPVLELLDVSENPLTSLSGVDALGSLLELYVTAGRVSRLADLGCLAGCRRLLALDISSNPVCAEPNYRRFVVFKCGPLRMLDGSCVDTEERAEAVGALSGLLSVDRLMETLSQPELHSITQLDLPASGLKQIDLPADCLQQLASLNLEDNELSLLCGLQQLRKLRVLNLANNAVRRLRERTDSPPAANAACFPALQVLVLSGNGLVQLAPLQLHAMRALQNLFLQDNQIKALDSVARCTALQLLVADRNQLQSLPTEALSSLANLRALHVEGNRLRRLPAAWPPQLRALYLANNKLNEPIELTRLSGRVELRRVSLYKNPLSRNAKWQAVLCASQPTLQVLDGSPVSDMFGGGPGLDGDGDSFDEDELDEPHGARSVWWRPQQAGVWNYRSGFR